MSPVTLMRASGLALVLGAVLALASTILFFLFTSGTLSVVVVGVFAGGLMLQLLGLPGIAARQARRAGWLGLVGYIPMFLAWMMLAGFATVLRLTVLPWLMIHAPQVVAQLFTTNPAPMVYSNVQLALVVVGGVLLGVAALRAGVLPRPASLLLIGGAVLSPVGLINGIVGQLGGALLVLALGWMGWALWMPNPEAVPAPILGTSGIASREAREGALS